MDKKLNAIHVGISGFPYGNAPINKCLAVYRALSDENIHVLSINNKALFPQNSPLKIKKKGSFDKVSYQYTTPSPYRPNSFIKRRYFNFVGRINEFLLINIMAIRKRIDVMFYYPNNGNFFELLYYRLLSKIYGFPLISHYVEYRSVFNYNQNKWTNLNYNLFDKYFMKFVDGILPISEFLINHLRSRGFKDNYLKIPPLVDFNKFKGLTKDYNSNKYFLFAGSLIYSESINLILDAYELVDDNSFYLYLIINGSKEEMININEKINKLNKSKLIKVFSNLEYNFFLELLFRAKALLIPLNDRIQDEARFPQKIAEYTATGNPLITTKYGEIKYYFRDNYNALVAEKDSPLDLSKKMNFVSTNPKKIKEIGLNGYNTGLKYFDNNSYSTLLKDFVLKLIIN